MNIDAELDRRSVRGGALAPLPRPLADTHLTLDPKPIAYFGRGRVTEVGRITAETGATSALIVTDPFLATSPVVAAVRMSLEEAGIIVTDKAKQLGVKSLSDIAELPADEQTFCIESEFSTRDDGWPGLKEAYGIDVPDSNVALLDTGVIYTATEKGDDCNFGEVFQTDGRIKGLDLVVMEDDKDFFPVYQGAFTLKQSTLDEYPGIADVLALMSDKLTTEVMQELNALADVDGEDPEDIALDWLTEQGLI